MLRLNPPESKPLSSEAIIKLFYFISSSMTPTLRKRKVGTEEESSNPKKISPQKQQPSEEKSGSNLCSHIFKLGLFFVIAPPLLNYATLQQEKRVLQPVNGTMFDIGFGQKLFMACRGHGSPTVILDGPAGYTSDIWQPLQEQLAAFTKVCVYDRAGIGFSDPEPYFNKSDLIENAIAGPSPYTTLKMVLDLHRLITFANPQQGKLVLIGSQLGAANMLAYAHSFPEQVGQLILLDPVHSSLFEDAEGWKSFMKDSLAPLQRLFQATAAVGINRIGLLLGLVNVPLQYNEQNEDLRNAYIRIQHFLTDPKHLGAVAAEIENLEVSANQLKDLLATDSKPFKIPTAVITGNYYDELLPIPLNRAWAKAAQNTISSIPGCQHYVINGADYQMIYKTPEEVFHTFKRFIKKLKKNLEK